MLIRLFLTNHTALSLLEGLLKCFDTFFPRLEGVLIYMQVCRRLEVLSIERRFPEAWVTYK